MSDVVIKAEGLGKKYLIGHQSERERYTALRDVLARNVKSVLHKTRQVLSGQQLLAGDEVEEFWALRDIDFEIKRGDRVGIIGRNGAGKSTLLKILSRITEPSTGRVEIRGRVASLLEVGTGFHPELTGRENIYLNGAILGMTRAEIKKKFDEIVDFAGVEKFLDTPVKRYSSGMYVRLAFAVAAHLEPEILVVDEVLAVGDAEFQKKCLGKMEDVSKNEGRTVLFVSHNMGAIKNLCGFGILLNEGNLHFSGPMEETLSHYESISLKSDILSKHISISDKLAIIDYKFTSKERLLSFGDSFSLGAPMKIYLKIKFYENFHDLSISIDIRNTLGDLISHITNEDGTFYENKIDKGDEREILVQIDSILFSPGLYYFDIWVGSGHQEGHYIIKDAFSILIEQSDFIKRTRPLPIHMKFFLPSTWSFFE